MELLAFLFVSLIAGYLAFYFIYGEGAYALLIGLLGALVANFICTITGHALIVGLTLYSIAVAFLGAVLLLFVWRAVRGRAVWRNGRLW